MSEAVRATQRRGRLPAFKAPRAPFPLGSCSPPPLALVAVPLQGKDKIWVKKESQQEGMEGRET